MSPSVYAESLRVEAQLIGGAHPLAVTSLRVWPTHQPGEWRAVEAPREVPLVGEAGAGFFGPLLFWRAKS